MNKQIHKSKYRRGKRKNIQKNRHTRDSFIKEYIYRGDIHIERYIKRDIYINGDIYI